MLSRLLLAGCLAFAALSSVVVADIPSDLITNIPGYGAPKTKQYSGLIPVDDAQTVFLHYWFVTSPNPTKDPVAIWMNGGPGCSSLEGGLYENGPYTFTGKVDNQTGIPTLIDNVNGWTTVASMIFLEQPAGVGFSYAVNGSMVSDDFIQSQNTYGFVLNFFKAFPEFANNDFYITGESYAGIYVPTLANRIVMGNAAGNPKVNIKGIAVGNGCWGSAVGTCSNSSDANRIEIEFFKGHSMISRSAYSDLVAECGPLFNGTSADCQNLINDTLNNVGNIDVYDVYDTCNDGLAVSKALRAPASAVENLRDPVTCLNSELGRLFMDNPDVRKAFHVDSVNLTSWETCYNITYSNPVLDERDMYAYLIKHINVLIYNGDADACVPWIGNYEWVRSMNIPESNPWTPWMVQDGDRSWTGGFVVDYGSNFHFLTIKHAGHMVPQYEPEAAITFFTNFIQNKPW